MNLILTKVAKRIYARISVLSWDIVFVLSLGHFVVSWLLLGSIDGEKISNANIFWYFYATTATTVGYGDYSPATEIGRLVTVLWIMPGGIALFTTIIAKVVQQITNKWRKRMRGCTNYKNLSEHIIILGWHGLKTEHMVDYIRGDEDSKDSEIVLCAAEEIENPMPDRVKFVRGTALNTPDLLTRAGAKTAKYIIALGDNDNETLSAALGAAAVNSEAHMVAYFDQQSFADLLKAHCAHAECNVSISIEMMVRSAQDPGSSRVQHQLLSTLEGPTQFSLRVPENAGAVNYGALFTELKRSHDATLFGVAQSALGDDLLLNAPSNYQVDPRTILYFMSSRRIEPSEINWSELSSK